MNRHFSRQTRVSDASTLQLLLDPKDLKIRQWWLIALIMDFLVGLYRDPALGDSQFQLSMVLTQIAMSSWRFYAIYHFAYKKFGNKWMIFDVTSWTSLYLLYELWGKVNHPVERSYFYLLLTYVAFSWYLIMSLKLTGLNKRIKKQYIPLS